MSAKVSIIVPVYNMELYIENTLNSLINQTYKNLEIICVDDGSKDKSAQIIKSFSEKDNRIKYIYKENSGVSAARNVGLEASQGEYITFVDGDDYLHYQALEILVECIEKTDCDIINYPYAVVYELKSRMPDFSDYKLKQIDVSYLYTEDKKAFSAVTKFIKSEIAKKFRFFEGVTFGEDACYMGFIFNEKLNIFDIDKPLYYYFRNDFIENHVATATSCGFNYKHLSILTGFDRLNDYLRNSDSLVVKDFYLKYTFRSLLTFRSQLIGSEHEKDGLELCKNIYKKWSPVLKANKRIPFKEKYMLLFFYRFRCVYELGRIITDPTMKDFYKNRKNRKS